MATFEKQINARDSLAELGSFVGRHLLSRPPPRKNGYCNLGCGWHYVEGYCNADFFVFNPIRRLLRKTVRPVDWALDLRYPFDCPDGFFDGIFCEHVLEHFDYRTGERLLAEMRRTTRAGGICRISVPSLEKFVAYYVGEPSAPEFGKWKSRARAMHSLTQEWGHKAVYDAQLLTEVMRKAGFEDVAEREYLESPEERLLLDQAERRWETIYVEGTVP